MKSKRKILFTILIILLSASIVSLFTVFTNKTKTYVNLIQGFTFKSPNINEVDTITAAAYLIFPRSKTKEDLRKTKDEATFYAENGITFLPLRHIPGDEKSFDQFIKEEFIPKALANKYAEEIRFTTDQNYKAYRFNIKNGVSHVVINSPIAYWISANPQALDKIDIINTFKIQPNANSSETARIAAIVDTFIERLNAAQSKETEYSKVLELSTNEYKKNFSKEKLEIFKHIFLRSYTTVDILSDSRHALINGVFEDEENNKYTRIQAELTRTLPWGDNWKISSFKMYADAFGLPGTKLKTLPVNNKKATEQQPQGGAL